MRQVFRISLLSSQSEVEVIVDIAWSLIQSVRLERPHRLMGYALAPHSGMHAQVAPGRYIPSF